MTAPTHFLSRAFLRHDTSDTGIRAILQQDSSGVRTAAAHRLIWTLFGDSDGRERDFLWREGSPGVFYLLSKRPPDDRYGLFRLDPSKAFAPVLKVGDKLEFVLRVNATVARKGALTAGTGDRARGKRVDVVMDALYSVPPAERAAKRREIIPSAAASWMQRLAMTNGFDLVTNESRDPWEFDLEASSPSIRAISYQKVRIGRGPHRSPMDIGVLDLEGAITVTDPEKLLRGILGGFGRAKSFGCGLMLIRRSAIRKG